MQFRTLDYNKQNTTRSALTPEPAQTKSSFIPNKCRLARQLTDETTRPTHPISENSSVDDWSRCLLLRQNGLSFPTKAVLPDNGRRDDTLPHSISENSSANGCSRNFELFSFFHVFINFFGGHVPPVPASYAYDHFPSWICEIQFF